MGVLAVFQHMIGNTDWSGLVEATSERFALHERHHVIQKPVDCA